MIGDDLVVKTAFVDAGPVIKRWRPRARGRSAQIRKRTCHITVTLVPGVTATVTRASRPRHGEAEAHATPKAAPKAKAGPSQSGAPGAEGEAAKAQAKAATPKKKTRKKKESDA